MAEEGGDVGRVVMVEVVGEGEQPHPHLVQQPKWVRQLELLKCEHGKETLASLTHGSTSH